MRASRESYYESVARRLAGSAILYGADSVVHVEAEDDIWFWKSMLERYRKGKYIFLPATKNEHGNWTSGCTQCLKYRKFLSQRFFICIDSDLRLLLGERLEASRGILQTRTYSWENHCVWAEGLQERFASATGRGDSFDFRRFLEEYSGTVYVPMLLMLYQERTGQEDFAREHFRRCISVVYRHGDERDNGRRLLREIRNRLDKATAGCLDGFRLQEEQTRYSEYGLREDNAYLYVRGHCIYNTVVSIGRKLCENTGCDFENDILLAGPDYGRYPELDNIADDIRQLSSLRKTI